MSVQAGVGFPQLQFSLGSRPSARNLATHFDPNFQPPVVMRKLGNVETIGISRTPGNAFRAINPERLALAVELARRNVQRARRSYCGTTTKEESKDSVEKQQRKAPLEQTTKSLPATIDLPNTQMQRDNKSKKALQKKKAVSTEHKEASNKVASLNKELQRRLLLWSEANVRTDESKLHRKHGKARHVNKRRWDVAEEDGEENKLEQWRKEQQARNARMMYDLSQQIKDLEKKVNRTQQCEPGINQQAEVVKKLAAAQRAALRTLQTFGSARERGAGTIPPELSLLIQQLALLAAQMGGGAATTSNSEITANVLQLVKTMEERQRVARLLNRQEVEMKAQRSEACEDVSAPAQRQKKGERSPHLFPARTSLLLDPRLQKNRSRFRVQPKKTHYTQETFNSLRRQQPPVKCAVSFCTPAHAQCSILNSSVVRPCQVALTFSSREEQRKTRQSKAGPNLEKPMLLENLKDKEEKMSVGVENVEEGAVVVEKPMIRGLQESAAVDSHSGGVVQELTSAIAQQSNQLELLRSEIGTKLTELKTELRSKEPASNETEVSEEKTGGDSKVQPVAEGDAVATGPVAIADNVALSAGSDQPDLNGSVSNDPHCNVAHNGNPGIRSLGSGVPGNIPVRNKSDVPLMLRRLEELEAEEDEISRRWTSVMYEDLSKRNSQHHLLPHSKPHTHLQHQHQNYRESHFNLVSYASNVPPPHSPSLNTLSSGVDKEVLLDYKERYSQYLDGTGLTTRGGFDPWIVAESIADALVDEVVEGVAAEVGQVCDGCAENLYHSEFLRPP